MIRYRRLFGNTGMERVGRGSLLRLDFAFAACIHRQALRSRELASQRYIRACVENLIAKHKGSAGPQQRKNKQVNFNQTKSRPLYCGSQLVLMSGQLELEYKIQERWRVIMIPSLKSPLDDWGWRPQVHQLARIPDRSHLNLAVLVRQVCTKRSCK